MCIRTQLAMPASTHAQDTKYIGLKLTANWNSLHKHITTLVACLAHCPPWQKYRKYNQAHSVSGWDPPLKFISVLFFRYPLKIHLVPLVPSEVVIYCKTYLLPSKDIFIMAFILLQGYIPAFIPLMKKPLATKTSSYLALDSFLPLNTARDMWNILLCPTKGSLCLLCSKGQMIVSRKKPQMLRWLILTFHEEDMHLCFSKQTPIYSTSRKTPTYHATWGGWLFFLYWKLNVYYIFLTHGPYLEGRRPNLYTFVSCSINLFFYDPLSCRSHAGKLIPFLEDSWATQEKSG